MSKETIEQYGYDDMDSDELDKHIAYWMRVKRGLRREGIECAFATASAFHFQGMTYRKQKTDKGIERDEASDARLDVLGRY